MLYINYISIKTEEKKEKKHSGKCQGEGFKSVNRATGFASANRFESRLTPNTKRPLNKDMKAVKVKAMWISKEWESKTNLTVNTKSLIENIPDVFVKLQEIQCAGMSEWGGESELGEEKAKISWGQMSTLNFTTFYYTSFTNHGNDNKCRLSRSPS